MDTSNPGIGVLLCVLVASIAVLYALFCDIRGGWIARGAVKRVRATRPAAWEAIPRVYRWVADASIKIRFLRSIPGVSDEQLERQFEQVRHFERRKLLSVGVVLLCVGLALIGSKLWGWSWG